MTNKRIQVPEPDQSKKDEPDQHVMNQVAELNASGSDTDDEAYDMDVHGYLPLTLSENDAGISEFHAEPMDSSDDEMAEENDEVSHQEKRELTVNTDLVLDAMKSISLPQSSIPSWADELSENDWNSMIQRTITGEKKPVQQSLSQSCAVTTDKGEST
ncbi:uncharacterized protein LOC120336256 [Styela clava]